MARAAALRFIVEVAKGDFIWDRNVEVFGYTQHMYLKRVAQTFDPVPWLGLNTWHQDNYISSPRFPHFTNSSWYQDFMKNKYQHLPGRRMEYPGYEFCWTPGFGWDQCCHPDHGPEGNARYIIIQKTFLLYTFHCLIICFDRQCWDKYGFFTWKRCCFLPPPENKPIYPGNPVCFVIQIGRQLYIEKTETISDVSYFDFILHSFLYFYPIIVRWQSSHRSISTPAAIPAMAQVHFPKKHF